MARIIWRHYDYIHTLLRLFCTYAELSLLLRTKKLLFTELFVFTHRRLITEFFVFFCIEYHLLIAHQRILRMKTNRTCHNKYWNSLEFHVSRSIAPQIYEKILVFYVMPDLEFVLFSSTLFCVTIQPQYTMINIWFSKVKIYNERQISVHTNTEEPSEYTHERKNTTHFVGGWRVILITLIFT